MDYGNSPQDLLLRVASEKSAVYGISWRKRGEAFSIVPNVARKVDRLGAPGAGDTELDTRMDLVNYLALYVGWTWRNIVGSYTAHAPALVARPPPQRTPAQPAAGCATSAVAAGLCAAADTAGRSPAPHT